MGVEGEEREKRKKERETETETDTEPHRTTLHHNTHNIHTHLPFLPPSVVFLMIPYKLLIARGLTGLSVSLFLHALCVRPCNPP